MLIAAAFKIEEIPFCIAVKDEKAIYEIAASMGIPWSDIDSAKFKTVKVVEA
jgi:hypothetical protein